MKTSARIASKTPARIASEEQAGPSRCAFLRVSALASAAMAAPFIVPATVFGTADKAAPSERIGIGHIGWAQADCRDRR